LPWTANNHGRVNPVQQRQPVQPINPFIINNRGQPGGIMPANGGQKKKQTIKNSKKYKNRKRQDKCKTRRIMKKRK
jgi:hypothetical protein